LSRFNRQSSFPLQVIINTATALYTEDVELDLYQLVGPIEESEEVEVHMPILGEGAFIHGKPIEP
jgi:hypothetical protein